MRSRWLKIFCVACALAQLTSAAQPNFVFILADDFAMNLIEYMTKSPYGKYGLKSLIDEGTTFNNFYVSDSLCCPSRSTIFTGRYPHNTGVFTNTWAPQKGLVDGGFGASMKNGDQHKTFALALHGATPAYTTAMLGKYLNGYNPWDTEPYNKPKATL
jgi:N-acetylglucosamine-6-sulfatase